jgi:integral membrane sensor domain MASE1
MKSASTLMEATNLASPPFQRATWRSSSVRQSITICLLVFAGYYLGARIGFSLTFQPHPVSVLWPPNSILLAALLLTPPRIWWLVLVAAFPAHCAAQWQSSVPTSMILCWFISNCFEALIGASLTRYFLRGPLRFVTLREAGICSARDLRSLFLFLPGCGIRALESWGRQLLAALANCFNSNVLAVLVTPFVVTWAAGGLASLRKANRKPELEAFFFCWVSF